MAEGLTQHVSTTQLGLQTRQQFYIKKTQQQSVGSIFQCGSNLYNYYQNTKVILRYQQFSLKHSKSLACDRHVLKRPSRYSPEEFQN